MKILLPLTSNERFECLVAKCAETQLGRTYWLE